MKRNKLGRTDLKVTEICLGTMTWGVQNTEAEGHAQIDHALEAGINFIDTAEVYAVPPTAETYGKTETIIGNWFKKTGKRDQWILASKISGGKNNPWIRNGSRPGKATVRQAVEASLKRLQTDHIDLYQIHSAARGHFHFDGSWDFLPENQNPSEVHNNLFEVLEAMGEMVKEGKIRHLGLSNESTWGIGKFLSLAEKHGLPRVVSVQNEYNLLRRHFDLDLAELSRHEDVGLLAYSPLASGVLTGKYLDGAVPAGSRGAIQTGGVWRHNKYSEPAVRAYVDLAREHGLDVSQMSIAFCLTRPFMTSVIIGATSLEQLKTDIGALDITLSDAVLAEISALYRRFPRTF
jgi:aryl-alcohol dehydrogenase-like predicted oxidoreductase